METRNTETVDPRTPTATAIRIFAPGTSVGERYEIREILGMGGTGVVYAAYDRELRRSVALKVLRSDRTSEAALKRFRREVAVARDAHSPHLVRVFDIAQAADSMYLTMELIDGESLRARLERGPMAIDEAISLSKQILTALAALHTLGIVHRDVKPGNILLTRDGVVKLADFGLARHLDRGETRATETEGVVGTFEYLSPEQALGENLDARSDLYSFGIVLFEMLAGEVPYRTESSIGTVLAHLKGDVPDVRKRRAEVPRWLAAMVRRLLERDRGRRYGAAAEILGDLEAQRRPRLRPRIPLAVASAVLVLVGTGIALAVASHQSTRFERLVQHGDFGGRALDRKGRVLWSHPTLDPGLRATPAVLEPGGRPVVAAILGNPQTPEDTAPLHRLHFLDAQTGRPSSQIDLPSAWRTFPDFSNTYGACGLRAVDINHDGVNELVASYCQHPYYPTYTVFYDPREGLAQVVFVGAGHHTLAGTLDVDEDGKDELILRGPSNRLGWYLGIAAVRIERTSSAPLRYAVAATPDHAYSSTSKRALAWYALVGHAGSSGFHAGSQVEVDRRARRIVITNDDGSRMVLGPHGLPAEVPAGEARARNAARARAYETIATAKRLAETGFAEKSLRVIEQAIADADRVGNEPLSEWARRAAVQLLIQAGHPQDAEKKLRDLVRFSAASDACFDAATAFHHRGDLDRAYRWYREGLQLVRTPPRGRLTQEFLEGILFVHAERGEWAAARAALDAYERAGFEAGIATGLYRDWIEWRSTGRFRRRIGTDQSMIDLFRYVALEADAQLAPGEDARTLAKIDGARFSGVYGALAQSLKAEIVARGGDPAQAAALASEALAEVRSQLNDDPAARAHLNVVESRHRTLVGKDR